MWRDTFSAIWPKLPFTWSRWLRQAQGIRSTFCNLIQPCMQIATLFYNSVYSLKMKLNIEAIHHVQVHLWIVDHLRDYSRMECWNWKGLTMWHFYHLDWVHSVRRSKHVSQIEETCTSPRLPCFSQLSYYSSRPIFCKFWLDRQGR